MPSVQEIAESIERLAPLQLQEDYDNSGLQVGLPTQPISRVLVALDVDEATVAEAQAWAAQSDGKTNEKPVGGVMIVSHHPVIFRPLRRLTGEDYVQRTVAAALRAGIALYAAHTNLDNAAGGVNSRMAEVLGLEDVTPLAPLPHHRLKGLPEAVVSRCGSGAFGLLPKAMTEQDFVSLIKVRFHCRVVKHNTTGRTIRRVALCGGSGSSFIADAIGRKADAYVTGEVGYHPFFGHPDLLVVEAGHFETEQYTCQLLADILHAAHPDLDVRITKRHANPVVVS